jgi:hypothetical protein
MHPQAAAIPKHLHNCERKQGAAATVCSGSGRVWRRNNNYKKQRLL